MPRDRSLPRLDIAIRDGAEGVELLVDANLYLLRYLGRVPDPEWMPARPGDWGPPFQYELSRDGQTLSVFAVIGDAIVSPIDAAIERALAELDQHA